VPVEPKAPERVVVVGAGPAGMATAIELAQQGVKSVVLEKRDGPATRENLFAVSGPYSDRLAALDPDGSLLRLLLPTNHGVSENQVTGERTVREYEPGIQPDPTRSRGDMDALLRAGANPKTEGADTRTWSKVPISDIEEGLRNLARTKHKDMIDLRQGVDVTAIRQGDGWAEAVLTGTGGASDAVRGALLVDASGRDLLGGSRTVYPEQSHWVGGRYKAPADLTDVTNVRRIAKTEDGDQPLVTIKLPGRDRTLVWAQVPSDSRTMSDADRAALSERRAAAMGVEGGLATPGRTAPVSVQLWTANEPVNGRVLKVGDSVRAPYFPTSTGAAAALVHDAPRAVDAILAVLKGGSLKHATHAYADAVRGANERLLGMSRAAMLKDLGIDPADAGAPTIVTQPSSLAGHASP
jgi:2-polyprenyl-6-methoxyphenol hydroxylase-like FAD-dependent oxidoreductase